MAKVSASAEAAAGPDKVWRAVVDLPRYAEWYVPHDGYVGEVPATLAEGTSYRQRVRLMGSAAEVSWRVTAVNEPGLLVLAGTGPAGVKAHSWFVIEPAGGGSRITLEMEVTGGALVGPVAGMVEKQVGTALRESLRKLTALLA